jgi:hypothetical protein
MATGTAPATGLSPEDITDAATELNVKMGSANEFGYPMWTLLEIDYWSIKKKRNSFAAAQQQNKENQAERLV